MAPYHFDLEEFFRLIEAAGVRSLLIGRQALIVVGLPVSTADIDLWVHVDDIDKLNTALSELDLFPTRTPVEARARGRYVLENDERVDVLVARSVPTTLGETVVFDDVWADRQTLILPGGARVALPSLGDLIRTKQFGSRPKDAQDVRLLQGIKEDGEADGSGS